MALGINQKIFAKKRMWIISSGKNTKLDLNIGSQGIQTVLAKEYKISDLARYLLNPEPIEVRKQLIGCEVYFRVPFSDKLRRAIRKVVPSKWHGKFKEKTVEQETWLAGRDQSALLLKDKDLEAHVGKIRSFLDGFDPVLKGLARLDKDQVADIVGICEDIGGNRSLLNLKGGIEEKIKYMKVFLSKDVGVILERAYVAEGLFEMSGFDFTTFNPRNSHRLIKFHGDGQFRFCVVDSQGEVEFWINDADLVRDMHLLEQSVKANPKFSEALRWCSNGDAKPLRLLFKNQLEIDYFKSPLPSLYKDLFRTYKVSSNEKETIIKSLKNSQLGILFNYVPNVKTGKKRLITNISVMHELSALDSIKNYMPNLYSIIDRMAFVSEAGKYYLLDEIRGNGNE